MKKSILIISIGIILFNSCRKEDSITITPVITQETVNDYFPLNTGNYWVYKQTSLDSSGNIIPNTWGNDSIVVKNDTIINSNTYHTVFEYNSLGHTSPYVHYYRDSSNCIVDNNGAIVFSINPGFVKNQVFAYLSDTIAYVNYYFVNQTTSITVPLGTYNCVDLKGELFRIEDNFNITRLIHNYYCKNIGSIKKTRLFVSSLQRIELDLLSYHVQ
ncbi:MAG: hypothetical protein HY951_13340 [Bacteroidia bacterium]|nr:hypothetical protein [Bacteroidia bacterium]